MNLELPPTFISINVELLLLAVSVIDAVIVLKLTAPFCQDCTIDNGLSLDNEPDTILNPVKLPTLVILGWLAVLTVLAISVLPAILAYVLYVAKFALGTSPIKLTACRLDRLPPSPEKELDMTKPDLSIENVDEPSTCKSNNNEVGSLAVSIIFWRIPVNVSVPLLQRCINV